MLAYNDVARLDISVQNPTAVRIVNCITHVQKTSQELAEFQGALTVMLLESLIGVILLDGITKAIPLDKPHRIKRSAVAIAA